MVKKVAILGAGISGLTAAWTLKKKYPDLDVTIFEKEKRPGGSIRTAMHQGSLFEWGPRSLRAHDAEAALELIEEMGLTPELISASPQGKKRYLLHQGKLVCLPTSFLELFSCALVRKCLPSLLNDLFTRRTEKEDETVYEFFARRFSTHVAEYLIDPLMKGIYAGDAKELSMRACFPKIWEMPRSVILGSLSFKKKKRGIVTLKRGMESLVHALSNRLQKEIQLNSEIENWDRFDQVISTLPAHALAKILPKSELKSLLEEIPFQTVGVVHLGFKGKVNPLEGFGYLIPSCEKEKVLGVIFDSSIFPEQNNKDETRLSVMINSSEKLKEIAENHVRKVLGIQEKPKIVEASCMQDAIPQYPVGFIPHLVKIQEARKREFPKLQLLGTSFHGISVNQAIRSAKDIDNYL